jgi:hypothetical protein
LQELSWKWEKRVLRAKVDRAANLACLMKMKLRFSSKSFAPLRMLGSQAQLQYRRIHLPQFFCADEGMLHTWLYFEKNANDSWPVNQNTVSILSGGM